MGRSAHLCDRKTYSICGVLPRPGEWSRAAPPPRRFPGCRLLCASRRRRGPDAALTTALAGARGSPRGEVPLRCLRRRPRHRPDGVRPASEPAAHPRVEPEARRHVRVPARARAELPVRDRTSSARASSTARSGAATSSSRAAATRPSPRSTSCSSPRSSTPRASGGSAVASSATSPTSTPSGWARAGSRGSSSTSRRPSRRSPSTGRATRAASPATRPLAAALSFRAALQRVGIRVAGRAVTGAADVEAEEVPLATIESVPLQQVLRFMDHESDNFTAELLLKQLGVGFADQGSSATGAAVVRQLLAEQGIPLAGRADRRRLGALALRPADRQRPGCDAARELARRGVARDPALGAACCRTQRHARHEDARNRGCRTGPSEDGHAERGLGPLRLREAPLRLLGHPERLARLDASGHARPRTGSPPS